MQICGVDIAEILTVLQWYKIQVQKLSKTIKMKYSVNETVLNLFFNYK